MLRSRMIKLTKSSIEPAYVQYMYNTGPANAGMIIAHKWVALTSVYAVGTASDYKPQW